MRLFEKDREHFNELQRILQSGPWPTRALEDNLADVKAQVAANIRGAEALRALARKYGLETVATYLEVLRERRRLGGSNAKPSLRRVERTRISSS